MSTSTATILHLEDSDLDAELVHERLRKDAVVASLVRVSDRRGFIEQLKAAPFDLILSDYRVPGFDGLEALQLALDHQPNAPFIFVSGAMGEEVAVETLRLGATDYILKHRLARLPSAIERALTNARERARRQLAEQRLTEQQDLLRTTLSSIGEAVISTDRDRRITFLNAEAERLAGWLASEAVGNEVGNVFRVVNPSHGKPVECPVARVLATDASVASEPHVALLSRDGATRPIDHLATPIRSESGRTLGVVLVFRDMTERRAAEELVARSEARFRSLVTASAQIVWTTDPQGRVVEDSTSWRAFTGQSYEEWKGHGWLDALHPEDRQGARKVWDRAIAERSLYQTEYRIRRHDGQYRWTAARGVPVLNSDGTLREWVGTNTDVTEHKAFEIERESLLESERAARSQAERASRMKDEFLATLSHELRTPLNAILGYATLLRHGDMSPTELLETAETIERNARVQAQLIEDLLDMNRIVSGKIRLDVRPLELPAVVDAALETVRPSADAKQVRLESKIDRSAGAVHGDPGRLQQVVWNLLSNAIKFTPSGGRVEVTLRRAASHLVLSVVDTGRGIDAEFLPHVFDRFRQADASTTRQYGGLGLGLAIVKHLVELHGGHIDAASEGAGKGSTFEVALPLAAVEAGATSEQAAPQPAFAVTEGDADLFGLRVLVVDDEPDACELVKRMLQMCRAEVQTARSASQALELMQTRSFDLLISDISMPDQDGYELIRRVRAMEQRLGGMMPALALTAFARSEDRQRALNAGFQDHLTKPVDRRQLIAVAAEVTGRMELDRQSR